MKVQKTGHTSPSICIVSASQAEVVQEATSPWEHVMYTPSPLMTAMSRMV